MKENRPRIEFMAPPICRRAKRRYTLRDSIEQYDEEHARYEDVIKAKTAKFMQKRHERLRNAIRSFMWFLIITHLMFVLEILIARKIFGF